MGTLGAIVLAFSMALCLLEVFFLDLLLGDVELVGMASLLKFPDCRFSPLHTETAVGRVLSCVSNESRPQTVLYASWSVSLSMSLCCTPRSHSGVV